jgi:hypothetical protein
MTSLSATFIWQPTHASPRVRARVFVRVRACVCAWWSPRAHTLVSAAAVHQGHACRARTLRSPYVSMWTRLLSSSAGALLLLLLRGGVVAARQAPMPLSPAAAMKSPRRGPSAGSVRAWRRCSVTVASLAALQALPVMLLLLTSLAAHRSRAAAAAAVAHRPLLCRNMLASRAHACTDHSQCMMWAALHAG